MIGLIRTQLLVSLALNNLLRRGKRAKSLGILALVLLCIAPGYGGYVALLYKACSFLAHHHLAELQDMVLTGTYCMAQITIVMVGVPIVYATLFQANDLSILLPLPIKPAHIVAAKLAAMYAIELGVGAALFLPALVMHALFAGGGPMAVANNLASLLLLPVVPLAVSAILSIAVVNVPGIGRNRWFWYLAMTTAVMAATLSFTMLTATGPGSAPAAVVQEKMSQLNQMGRLLPGSVAALRAMTSGGVEALLWQAANIAIAAAYLAGTLLVGQWLYIGPILRGSGASARGHRRAGASQARGFIASYVRKEFAATLKDPAVAMNAVGGYVAIPLLGITYTAMKVQSHGKVDIIGSMLKGLHSPQLAGALPYVAVGLALGLALFGMGSSLFSASYSKDGKRLWIEKTLPVPPFHILLGKLAMGMLLVSPPNLLTIVLAGLAAPFSVWLWVYVAVVSELLIGFGAAVGLSVDCRRPKLVWKDTVQAVKQNVNVVIGMGLSGTALAANGALLWGCHAAGAPAGAIYGGVLALNAALLAAGLLFARRSAEALANVVV